MLLHYNSTQTQTRSNSLFTETNEQNIQLVFWEIKSKLRMFKTCWIKLKCSLQETIFLYESTTFFNSTFPILKWLKNVPVLCPPLYWTSSFWLKVRFYMMNTPSSFFEIKTGRHQLWDQWSLCSECWVNQSGGLMGFNLITFTQSRSVFHQQTV